MDLSSVEIFPFVLCNCNVNRAKTPFCLLILLWRIYRILLLFFFWVTLRRSKPWSISCAPLIKPNDSAFLDLRPKFGANISHKTGPWSGGPGFDPRCGRPLPTGRVGVSIMWPAEIEVMHGLPALSHVWQHVKLSDALSWGPSAI